MYILESIQYIWYFENKIHSPNEKALDMKSLCENRSTTEIEDKWKYYILH